VGSPRLRGGVPGELDGSGMDGGVLDVLGGDAVGDEPKGGGRLCRNVIVIGAYRLWNPRPRTV
jgi:hypothetical protein